MFIFFLDSNAAQKTNVYQSSPAHSRPIAVARLQTMSPVGSPSSVSSSGSSVTSPTGPCPLSIPRHMVDDRNKARSMSDPPELSSNPQPHREKQRRQSEQVGSVTCPVNFQGVPSGSFSPNGIASRRDLSFHNPSESYDVLPSPRSRDTYDNLPSPQRIQRDQETQENYDNVPLPRPLQDRLASPSSPITKSKHHLSPRQDDYDAVPVPRPVSQASSRSSQEVYDFVPPPRPTSSCSETQDLYDVPPAVRTPENENYDIVPPARRTPSSSDVPPGFGKAQQQDNYDTVPLPRPTSHNKSLPVGRVQEQENYDFVPQPRPVSSYSQDGKDLYDVPPFGRVSEQANYDVVPPLRRQGNIEQDASKENYDVVPIPRPTSQEIYDVVPPARPARIQSDSGTTPRDQSSGDPRFSDVYNAHPIEKSGEEEYHWVRAPYQARKDVYDTIPKTNRPVSADSGLNASFSSICSLKSDGQDDRYDAPLPPVPNEKRDSGSLSDETPDYDQDPEEIYDKPPSLATRDSIYDVPPPICKSDYDVLPLHSNEIYDIPPNTSDDIYDVPPQHPNQGMNVDFIYVYK